MAIINISNIEPKIKEMLLENLDIFNEHQWPLENSRWTELLFSLVLSTNKNHQDKIRDVISTLGRLNLLEVPDLAGISDSSKQIEYNTSSYAARIYGILTGFGFNHEESKSSLLIMSEAAKGLMQNHGGKIQKYLRKYGQQMINELGQNFSFTNVDAAAVTTRVYFMVTKCCKYAIKLE